MVPLVYISPSLLFSSCLLDDAAMEIMRAFFQTPLLDRNGAVVCESSLREISFKCVYGDDSTETACCVASMLAVQGAHLHSTIGSHVSTVSIDDGELVDAIISSASRMRFSCLRLDEVFLLAVG
jgi:hypothetical protein